MSEESHVRTEEQPGVITVILDRPAKLNAISPQITAALWDAVTALGERDDLRCMVITSVGKYFTAGMDMSAGLGGYDEEAVHPGWGYRRAYRQHHQLYDELESVEKPVIQAVQGVCLGAGVEMAMSCDFRFCTPNAEFALPEVDIGLLAGSGGTTRLTRLVGPAWGKWMAMAGMRVSAEQANAIGLVHQVLPSETFLEDVYSFCTRLISIPPDTLGLAKLTVDMTPGLDRVAQRQIDRITNTTLIGSKEHRQRIERFRK
jgi:enoyl-CoA hydratase